MNNNYEYVKRVKENKEEQEKLKEQLQNIIDIIDLPEDEQKKLIDEVLANALETYSPNNMINFQAYLKNKLKKEIERKYFTPSTIIPIEKQKIINLFLSKRNDKFLTEEEIRKKLQIDSGTLYQGISILSSQSNKIKSELLRIFPNYKQQLKERKVYFKQPITLSETDLRYLGYYIGEINDICLDIHEIAIKEGKSDMEIEKQLKTIFQLLTDKNNMELVKKQYPQCEMMLQIKAANFGIKLNKEKTKIEKERATNPINETPKQPQKKKKKTSKKEKKEKPLLSKREETTLKELAKNPNIKREKLIELVGYTSSASLYVTLRRLKEKCNKNHLIKEKVLELYPDFLKPKEKIKEPKKERPLLSEKEETILKGLATTPTIKKEELRELAGYKTLNSLLSAINRLKTKCNKNELIKEKVLELYPDFLKPKEKVKNPKKEKPLLSEKQEKILKELAQNPNIKNEELRKLVGYESLSGLASTISKLKIKCNKNKLIKEKALELYPDFLKPKEKVKKQKKQKKESPLLSEKQETILKELAKNPEIRRKTLAKILDYKNTPSLNSAINFLTKKCQQNELVKEKVLELCPNFLTKEKPLLTEKQEIILKELAENPNISAEELRKKLKYQSISTLYSALYRIREKCQEDEKAKAKILELYPDFLKSKKNVEEPKKEKPLLSEKEEIILKELATTPTIKKEELRELAGYKTLNSLLSAINRLKNKCKQNELVKEKVLELYPDFLTLKENKTLSESEKSLLLALQSSKTPLPSLQSIIHNTICKSKIKVDKKIASIKRKSEKSADFSQAVLTIYPKFFEQEEYISQFSEQQLNLLLVLKDHYEKPMTKQQIADTLNYKNKNNITSLWKTIKEKVENNEKAKSEALAIHPKFLEHKISFVKKKRKATKTHKKETLTEKQEKILTALKQKSKIQEIAEKLNYKSANTVYATIYNIRKKCQESNTFKEEVLAIYPEFLIPKDKSLSETSLSEKEIQVLQGLYLITPPQTTYLSQKELATMFQCQQPIISKIKEQALKKIAEQKEIQEELQKTWPTFNQDKTIKEQYKSSRSVKMPGEDVEGIKSFIRQFDIPENEVEKTDNPILTGIKNLEESIFSTYASLCTEEQKAMLALRLGFINAPSTTETVAKLFNVEQQEVITLTKNCLQSAKSSLKEKPLQKKKGELRKS